MKNVSITACFLLIINHVLMSDIHPSIHHDYPHQGGRRG